ncbi:hypothetical protein RFI_01900 [Reticulomyxa filosa]|uniref:Uncharacterized protein n=1 Tax=Reticulomyxa filosa TaxID=46433 RepID=X6P9F8_RETFI|nr:hypothetical protein RFI_01900 [Reticulomyxa filosa]|eukprot:ETO35175.1 hypothetical protein RFI_01900 [Reticulomyxa filosa]
MNLKTILFYNIYGQRCLYHTFKRQYKYICSYPNDVELKVYCVVQLIHLKINSNEIHLSFGEEISKLEQLWTEAGTSLTIIESDHLCQKTWTKIDLEKTIIPGDQERIKNGCILVYECPTFLKIKHNIDHHPLQTEEKNLSLFQVLFFLVH